MSDVLYTMDEVAEKLKVSRSTVLKLVRSGKLRVYRFTRNTVRVSEAQLRQLRRSSSARRPVKGDPKWLPTTVQTAILQALNGRALRTDALAREAKVDRSRLFRKGGIKELIDRGVVSHHPRAGYYSTDAPPAELQRAT